MFDINYQGMRWGYVFMKTDSRLSQDEREELLLTAVKMELTEKKRITFSGDRYEGTMRSTGKIGILGAFTGSEYIADLDVEKEGRMNLKFLVDERTSRMAQIEVN